MQLNVNELPAIRQSYLEAEEDERAARIEYEQDKTRVELKKTLKEAANLQKKIRNTIQ